MTMVYMAYSVITYTVSRWVWRFWEVSESVWELFGGIDMFWSQVCVRMESGS